MSHTITGRLHLKGAITQVTEKFAKRDFVIIDDTNEQYPQYISLQLSQDKCSYLDNISEGTTLTAHFNIRGREWNGPQGVKYFNTLDAWKIETAQGQQVGSHPQQPTGSAVQVPATTSQQLRPVAAQPMANNTQTSKATSLDHTLPTVDDLPF